MPLPKVQNPEWNNPEQDFVLGDSRKISVLNLIWHTTPRSLVNWLSGIPPAPTIHYAKKHVEWSEEGYSYLVADTYVAGASFRLSASFAAQAISTEISFESVAAWY